MKARYSHCFALDIEQENKLQILIKRGRKITPLVNDAINREIGLLKPKNIVK